MFTFDLEKDELSEVFEIAEQVQLEGKSADLNEFSDERGKYKPSSQGFKIELYSQKKLPKSQWSFISESL